MHSFFSGAWAACIIFSSGKNLLREKVFNALLHMIISCYVLISLRWEHSGELNWLKSPASTTLIVFVMITLILFGVLRIFDPARVRRLAQNTLWGKAGNDGVHTKLFLVSRLFWQMIQMITILTQEAESTNWNKNMLRNSKWCTCKMISFVTFPSGRFLLVEMDLPPPNSCTLSLTEKLKIIKRKQMQNHHDLKPGDPDEHGDCPRLRSTLCNGWGKSCWQSRFGEYHLHLIFIVTTFIRWSYVDWYRYWPTFSTRRPSHSCSSRLFTLTGAKIMKIMETKIITIMIIACFVVE